MERAGSERMEMKKHRLEEEESDRMNKQLKTETESEIINKQGAIIDYGDDSSYYYDSEEDKADAHKYDDDSDFCVGMCEDESDVEELEYDYIANGRPTCILTWDEAAEQNDSYVHPVLCCTPRICVIFLDGTKEYIPIDSEKPLPVELYEDHKTHDFMRQTKKMFDITTKDTFKVQIGTIVMELNLDLQRQIARLALSYFRNTQDGDYEYVRGVKTRAAFSQRFGIHMIFIAHPRGDDSAGKLFSVHVATGDPPVVLDCRILCDIDPQCIHEGIPRLQGKKLLLRRSQIACKYCAEEYNEDYPWCR